MSAEFWITQAFNGISYGALLFLLASGLSLIFGVMRIVNLAHGSYFMLGGYVGLSVVWRTGSFLAALVASAVAIALIGIGMERLFLRRLPGQTLGQVLMTVGFALMFQDVALLVWGGDPYTIPVPAALQGIVTAGTLRFPAYRIFIIAVAILVGAGLWVVLDRTRVGAMIRAAVDDREMAQGVGIHVPVVSLGVFALGAALAALGGVIGGGFLGVYPGADFEVLPYAFVVVIVGGLGSLPGAMVGSLLVGLLDNFGKALFPELSYFTLFAPMALILALRPTGLFGRA
ncbi:MAG: branched-chain amino acid ABC transporter permease [Candidatus Rokubacteria bacterium 13_2_20CM_69_15_2]|nr:MAG: branched-chain amino acid ABC transporter permease [Candidatus Rokubacteria bacterium 13_2_20CM_69_15_2]